MHRILFAAALTLLATPAFAQDSALNDRLLRLERDVNFMQREVYANGATASSASAPMDGAGAAQVQVRLTQIDEEIRRLRGEVEQAQYLGGENRRQLTKMQEDFDLRLQALEQAQPVSAAMGGAAAAPAEAPAAAVETPAAYQPEAKKEERAVTGADFPDSNTAYNAAFKLLNAKKYSEAATAFDGFVKKYPKDPLTSNAYYWLGESYYARGDYTRAAEGFRKGFETSPEGQKAPDNLLKLALSLDKIKRSGEACIVLGQITGKYGDKSPRTAQRADAERSRLQCQ